MSDLPKLPFDIGYDIGKSLSSTRFYAIVGNEKLNIGKYSPGDDVKRRKLATTWSKDKALQNGTTVAVTDIARVLQFAEIEAAEAF